MRAVDVIARKRDGLELEDVEIEWLVEEYSRGAASQGAVGEEQMAAFLMAVFFRGLSDRELSALVRAMMASGTVVDLSHVPAAKIDKHSTGGVGDKISICLAPLVAVWGVAVPMISGRGLGHTGGTLDKLAAIPGFRTDLEDAAFRKQVAELGVALIGQTATLAPADRKIYALRDVTGTVPSTPLIAASIMSKKLAEGIDGLVLDAKCGSGAFMKTEQEATRLAETMIAIGARAGCRVRALITDMNQVLGRACGNANETWEAIEVLKGGGPSDVVELTVELGAEMLVLGRAARELEEGRTNVRRAIADGRGLELLRRVVVAQGGDPRSLDDRRRMPMAAHRRAIRSTEAGVVTSLDVEAIGRAAMILGAGRARASDAIDLSAGFEVEVRPGDRVAIGDALAIADYNDEARFASAESVFRSAVAVGDSSTVPRRELVLARLPREDVASSEDSSTRAGDTTP